MDPRESVNDWFWRVNPTYFDDIERAKKYDPPLYKPMKKEPEYVRKERWRKNYEYRGGRL